MKSFVVLEILSFYRNTLKPNRNFEYKPCKADMDNFQASIFYLHFKGFYLLTFFNLSGKMFEILGPRNT